MDNILAVQDLSKTYNKKKVLTDVSFSIGKGEVLGLIGANGAGKSTLIKTILGLVFPSSGSIKLFDSEFSIENLKRVSYVGENAGFNSELSGIELLKFFCKIKQTSEQRVNDVLEVVGMKNRAGSKISSYSKGMLQRLAIAQSIIHDSEFYILDEPLSGLDPRAQIQMEKIINQLKKMGKTILLCTHSINELANVCSRIIVLERGRIIRDSDSESCLSFIKQKYQSSEPWDEDPIGSIDILKKVLK